MLTKEHERYYAYAASRIPKSVSDMRKEIKDTKEREIFDGITNDLGEGDPVWLERNLATTD